MVARNLKLLVAIAPLLLSGCYCLSGGRQQVRSHSAADIENSIKRYEADGTAPEMGSIGEFYAFRSATKAYYKPQFAYSHTFAAFSGEAISKGKGRQKLEGAPYLVALPFVFVADIALYPVNFAKSLFVSKADLASALCDLQTARSLGYSERTLLVEYYVWPGPTLDNHRQPSGNCN